MRARELGGKMEGWIKLAASAVLGAASAIISVTLWVSEKENVLQAHEASITRLQATDNLMYDQLNSINDRLSRIEGKLDVILNDKYH